MSYAPRRRRSSKRKRSSSLRMRKPVLRRSTGYYGRPHRRRRMAVPRTAAAQSARRSGPLLNALGSVAGGLAGGPSGAAVGRAVAQGAGALMNYISGHGDYKVSSNTLLGGSKASDTLPRFATSDSGVRVLHREYITDVVTSATAGAFSLNAYAIQPAYTFPWLSTIAQQFQQYRINGMVFEYKSTSCDALNSTNTALGEVVLSTQYNVLSPAPQSLGQMYQLEFVSTCKPSESVLHPIECAKNETSVVVLDTRNGSASSITGSDLRLYDFANFYIATAGMQATSVNIGQLWVTYDITLLKPWLGNSTDLGDHYAVAQAYTNTITNTTILGSFVGGLNPILSSTSDFGTYVSYYGPMLSIVLPPSYVGNFMMLLHYKFTGATAVSNPNITTGTGITGNSLFNNYGGNISPGNAKASTDSTTTTATNNPSQYLCAYLGYAHGGNNSLANFLNIDHSGGSFFTGSNCTDVDLFIISFPSTLTD